MDTSDSECFESADESFHSDDESVIANGVQNLTVKDSKSQLKEKHVELSEVEKNLPQSSSEQTETVVDTAKDAETSKNKSTKAKLGTKLTKTTDVISEQTSPIKSDPEAAVKKEDESDKKEENLWEDDDGWGKKIDIKKEPPKPPKTCSVKIIVKKEDKSKKKPDKSDKKEENLWEGDDDWGNATNTKKAPKKVLKDYRGDETYEDFWENWTDVETVKPTVEAELEILKKEAPPPDPPFVSKIDLADTFSQTGHINGRLCSSYLLDEDRWQIDSWEPIEFSDEDPSGEESEKEANAKPWPSWTRWDVSRLLSTATQSVSTLTSQVSQGFTNVLEVGIGVPNPELMARINAAEENESLEQAEVEQQEPVDDEEQQPQRAGMSFGLGNLVSGVSQITKIVETTGNKVILGGLDTLETIGKKTMEVLQEGDPGLKKKRAFLKIDQDRPVLSQILREAKEKAEQENKELQQKHLVKKPNYESMFDDYQGLVHLEALEMLSKQCDIKLQTLVETCAGDALKELQETLEQVKELCEIPDEDEEENLNLEEIKNKLESAVNEINVPISYGKLISSWEETDEWLRNLNLSVCSEAELHKQAIETLAQLTALAVEQFHKMGELLLVKEYRSTADEADSLVQ